MLFGLIKIIIHDTAILYLGAAMTMEKVLIGVYA